MSTRLERLKRREQGQSARQRVLSGMYNQPQQEEQPYQSTRLRAMESHDQQVKVGKAEENKQYANAMKSSRLREIAQLDAEKQPSIDFTQNLYAGTNALRNHTQPQPSVTVPNGSLAPMIENRNALQNAIDANAGKNYSPYASEPPVIRDIHRGLDKFANSEPVKLIGKLGQEFYTPGAGLSVLNAAEQGASNLVGNLAPGLGRSLGGKIAKNAATQAIVGAPAGVGNQLARDPQSTRKQLLEAGAYGAGGGAVTGALGPLLGKAFGSFMNRGKAAAPEVEKRVTQLLALPEPKPRGNANTAQPPDVIDVPETGPRLLMPSTRYEAAQRLRSEVQKALPEPKMRGNANAAQTPDVIYGAGRVHNPEPLGLPQGNFVPPTRLKPASNDQVLNRVMERIRPIVTERMTPPLENPNELAKWVQAHLGADVSLNEVRKLSYEDLRQMAEMMRSRLSVADEAHKAASEMGYNLDELLNGKLPDIGERVAQNAQERVYGVFPDSLPNVKTPQFNRQHVGGLASPIERVGRAGVRSQSQPQPQFQQADHPITETPEQVLQRQRLARKFVGNLSRANELEKPIVGRLDQSVSQVFGSRTQSQPPIQRVGRAPNEPLQPMRSATESKAVNGGLKPMKPAGVPIQAAQEATPKKSTPDIQMRGFAQTLHDSEKPPQGFKERLKSAYTPITNEQTLAQANKRISKDVEESTSFVLGSSRFTAEKAATAQRLIDHYNGQGNFQRAVDIAQKVSEEATKAGQSIQALSMFNRLTAEGILIHAQRIAKKTNEAIPIGAKEVKVTEDMAASIAGLAQTTQKMTGVKDLASNVIDILDRAKSGAKLSDTEAQQLKRFVNESKQFVEETTRKPRAPRPPLQPKDKRVRDNVVSFLDAQEKAAKERLRAKGIRISSTPLDVWADYAIIGAAKMGKGTIKFTDWSEQMVKDVGEEISPHLQNLYERARETFEMSAKKVSQLTVSEAERITERVIKAKKDSLSTKEVDSLRSLAQKVSALSGDAKRIASQDLQSVLQTLEKPGVLRKISSVQTMAQLFNPKTLLTRNPLGNELFYRVERMNKLIATPIDWTRVQLFGGQRSVTFRTHNQGQYWKNFIEGAKAGWKGVNVNGLETQYDLTSPAFSSKLNPLTYLEKALGASLRAFDNAAYMRAVNNTLGELATIRAINEGQRGNKALIQKYIREADDHMARIAGDYGKYVTFQDSNIISKGLVGLKRGLNFGKDFGVGDLVLKYPKTPGALLMRAIEFSPAGFIRSGMIAAKPILFKQEPNTTEVMMALSRAIIGTGGFMGIGYFLMDKGILTGAASKDKDIRDLQRSSGQGQYQVNLSALIRWVKNGFNPEQASIKEGDTLYTYDWMQPISIALSIGANANKNIGDNKGVGRNLGGTILGSLEGGVNTLTEQSVLSGLKSAAEGYPGQTVTDKLRDIISEVPASFVPSLLNQVKQTQDNSRRETYDPNKLNQSLNKAQAKLPNVPLIRMKGSKGLPQQYDTLGKPKQTYQNNNPFNVFLNPGFSSNYELSPEAKFVVDMISETGDESLAPRVPGKTITIEGKSVKLSGEEFSRLQRLQGEETQAQIQKRMSGDIGKSLDTRTKNISKSLTKAGSDARKTLSKEMGLR